MEGGRAHDAIHRGFQSDRFGRDLDPDYPMGIRLPALPEETGGTLALGIDVRDLNDQRFGSQDIRAKLLLSLPAYCGRITDNPIMYGEEYFVTPVCQIAGRDADFSTNGPSVD
jgi:hypothetical protein